MKLQPRQTRLNAFGDYDLETSDLKALEGPFDDLINPSNERMVLAKFPRFADKNKRLSDPLYKLFGYSSKVYYEDIAVFIEAFTKPGDLILDPMSGAGSTAIAALKNGRKVIVNDASPCASFVSKGFVLQIDSGILFDTYSKLKKKVEDPILSLYRLPCHCPSGCPSDATVENIYVSDWYECPRCSHHFALLGNYSGKRSIYSCPQCGRKINIGSPEDKRHRIKRRRPTILDIACNECKCGKVRHKRAVNENDLKVLHDNLGKFRQKYEDLWVPTTKIVSDRCYPRKGGWPGFSKGSSVSTLFSPINLSALALLYKNISEIATPTPKHFMLFTFLSSLIRCSRRMYTTSVIKNYYQVPPVGKVQNVLSVFERKFRNLIEAKKYEEKLTGQVDVARSARVYNFDAKKLPMPQNSVDYVFLDPPYGGQVPYFELNLFYSSWLKQEERWDEEVVIPMDTDSDPRFVEIWARMITPVLQEVYRVLKPGKYFTLMFHSKSDLIWNRLQEILFRGIGVNKGFSYKFIHSMERGTTFHINQRDSTNPKTAFITYQKPFDEKIDNNIRNHEKIDWPEVSLQKIAPLGNRISLWEAQNELIIYVHEKGIFEVPSTIEIIAKLGNEGWNYDPESDELIKSG